jgi:hypothetical protein
MHKDAIYITSNLFLFWLADGIVAGSHDLGPGIIYLTPDAPSSAVTSPLHPRTCQVCFTALHMTDVVMSCHRHMYLK